VTDDATDQETGTDTDTDTDTEHVALADAVVIAADEGAARALLAPWVTGLPPVAERRPEVEVVTLVVESAELDAAPRGSGVLTVPGTTAAKALTHATAKWEWVARAAQGRHVVRVSFGAQGEKPATSSMSDQDAARLALAEAAVLLGVDLPPASLIDAHRERYAQSQPASALGQAEAAATARKAIAKVDGIGVVGAWLAGTGLAQVIPDAIREAERLRAHLLWE
jgi:protoporphyrinogen/coproporphyrinogen III oxidase